MRLRAQLLAEQRSRHDQEQALQQQIADERARRDGLTAELQRERDQGERSQELIRQLQREREESTAQTSQPAIASLMLLPVISRSGGAHPTLAVPQSARRPYSNRA
jgi:hypothetical protein